MNMHVCSHVNIHECIYACVCMCTAGYLWYAERPHVLSLPMNQQHLSEGGMGRGGKVE